MLFRGRMPVEKLWAWKRKLLENGELLQEIDRPHTCSERDIRALKRDLIDHPHSSLDRRLRGYPLSSLSNNDDL